MKNSLLLNELSLFKSTENESITPYLASRSIS